jgi:voltage-gated sodium channel
MPTIPAVQTPEVAPWRLALMAWLDSSRVQGTVIAVILLNAVILGLEATPLGNHASFSGVLALLDSACLTVFVLELLLKALAHRTAMLRSGWNIFDILVVAIALVPATGPFSVLRSLRVLRVFRLLTTIPSLRRVVAAFIHAIPGLTSVMALLAVFFFVAAVMATGLFGAMFPEWFGHLGRSLYTLFQIMTLESWSMSIVRPIMAEYPWAWTFFLPFIVLATFTILNLFIGIIVSTMQELSMKPTQVESVASDPSSAELLSRIERDVAELRRRLGA